LFDNLNMSDHYGEMNLNEIVSKFPTVQAVAQNILFHKSEEKKLSRGCFTLISHKFFVSILVLLIKNLKNHVVLVIMAKK
jgi:hypothetical protein